MTSLRRAALLATWIGLLAVALVALALAGHGQLAAPPVTAGAGALRTWASERDAPTIVMSGLRLTAIALAWYLLATTVLGAAARLSRAAAAVRWADAVTVPAVRRLLGGATGLVLTAAPIGLTPPHSPPAATSQAPRLERVPPNDATAPRLSILTPATPTPSATPTPPATPATPASSTPGLAGDAPVLTPLPGPASTWTVQAGDSFWRIATITLAGARGRTVTDAEVDPYWEAVVAANRTGLADPNNPSLIYPGQVMTLPPPPPAP